MHFVQSLVNLTLLGDVCMFAYCSLSAAQAGERAHHSSSAKQGCSGRRDHSQSRGQWGGRRLCVAVGEWKGERRSHHHDGGMRYPIPDGDRVNREPSSVIRDGGRAVGGCRAGGVRANRRGAPKTQCI